MQKIITLTLFAAVSIAASAGSAAADKIPNLVGTWVCSGPTVSKAEGQAPAFSTTGETVRIDAQEQYAFYGVAIVEYNGAQHEEPFVGMVAANKRTAMFIEADGYKQWKILGKNRTIMEDDEYNPEYIMTRRAACTREAAK